MDADLIETVLLSIILEVLFQNGYSIHYLSGNYKFYHPIEPDFIL